MIMGRYEHLAIDSQMRAFVAKKYFQGQPVSMAQIRATYAPWGKWQYLAYWFDPGDVESKVGRATRRQSAARRSGSRSGG